MPTQTPPWLDDLVAAFGAQALTNLSGPGEREEAIKAPLASFVQAFGVEAGHTVVLFGEVRDEERRARPDFGVQTDGAIVGYLEVKAPNHTLDPTRFTGHNLEQWNRLKDLPNLMYTNGTEWRLYRDGERVDDPVQLEGGALDRAGENLAANPALESVLRQFLGWTPAPIRTVPRLVAAIAPLTGLLRSEVTEKLRSERQAVKKGAAESGQPFLGLASDWRRLLFPDATDEEFADGYAQTVTFALLLATSEGHALGGSSLHDVGNAIRARHTLMGRALQLLTDTIADEFQSSLQLLSRVIDAIEWDRIRASARDTYLYLYEEFLEVYDPDLRQRSGSYYTPIPVVEQMVRLSEEALVSVLGRQRGFLDPAVTVVDPAMGTGTYLNTIIEHASAAVEALDGPGAVAGEVADLATRLIGFELQTGPYAVAELRLNDMLHRYGATTPPDGLRTYVTNTLDDPYLEVDQLGSHLNAISDSRRRANEVKANTPVTVVIGNPPYRERAEGEGGWVEKGDEAHGDRARPILDDFRAEGNGRYEYVLKNLYVYFWRWATWKVFDADPGDHQGVVCFISTNGYQRGPGFRGLREYIRRTCAAGWVIDVSPEGHRPDVATRVFPGVQQQLSIGLFVRRADTTPDVPADIKYIAVAGRREQKYEALTRLRLDDPAWRAARTDWQAPFTPAAESSWDEYPALDDLFPWAAPGIKPNRTWVYSPSPDVLRERWNTLVAADDTQTKREMFKESDSARLDLAKPHLPGFPSQPNQSFGTKPGSFPAPVRVGYRAFDRQWLIPDSRLIHRPSPPLWASVQVGQAFIVEQHSKVISSGPATIISADMPDMDHFKGSEGGRALPFLHPSGAANVAPHLCEALGGIFGFEVAPGDLLAYVTAVTSHDGFTTQFEDELTTPGVRVPLTREPDLWQEAVQLGKQLVWAQTYGRLFADPTHGRKSDDVRLSPGSGLEPPVCTVAVSEAPSSLTYDPATRELHVGDGVWAPVDPRVMDFHVGGRRTVKSWFDYRKKNPGGTKRSPLDNINATTWPREWTSELNELLALLTRVVAAGRAQGALLDKIVEGRILTKADLAAHSVRWPSTRADHQPRYETDGQGAIGEQLTF